MAALLRKSMNTFLLPQEQLQIVSSHAGTNYSANADVSFGTAVAVVGFDSQ